MVIINENCIVCACKIIHDSNLTQDPSSLLLCAYGCHAKIFNFIASKDR